MGVSVGLYFTSSLVLLFPNYILIEILMKLVMAEFDVHSDNNSIPFYFTQCQS